MFVVVADSKKFNAMLNARGSKCCLRAQASTRAAEARRPYKVRTCSGRTADVSDMANFIMDAEFGVQNPSILGEAVPDIWHGGAASSQAAGVYLG
jgi:hypothetical protein